MSGISVNQSDVPSQTQSKLRGTLSFTRRWSLLKAEAAPQAASIFLPLFVLRFLQLAQNSMKDVQQIPYDIWHLIFQYTCTDGGLSGCALARTSKTFRALSASTRFYSLAFSSVIEVKNFLVCLERIHRSERAPFPSPSTSMTRASTNAESSSSAGAHPIHHLLLAFLPDTCDAPQRTFRRWTDYARDERSLMFQLANDHKTWAAHKTYWNRECVLHVSRLLQVAAPTLRTLAVLQCAEVRLPLVHYHQLQFPFLRELTLLADDRIFVRAPGEGVLVVGQNDPSDFDLYGVPAEPPEDAPFPALTHLHVVCAGAKLHPWEHTLPMWAPIAPAVTHLRISQACARTPAVLADMLGVPPLSTPPEEGESEVMDSEELLAQEPEPSYPSLETVIVQMSSAKKTNGAEDPSLRELRHIADVCEAEGGHAPRVAVLRSRTYMPGYWEGRLRWEWQSRMVGGGGCWTEDEEHENVWKDFHDEDRPKRSRKGRIKVSIREARDGGLETDVAEAGRPGKKWWKVLANGMPRLNRRRSMSVK